MKKLTLFAAAAVVLLPLVANAGPMKAGKWHVTIETPAGEKTVDHCITKEEADKPQPPKMKAQDCKVDEYKIAGNVLTWKMSCPSMSATMEMKTIYGADSFVGEMHMKMGDKEMTQKSSGKYLGPCDAADQPKK
jgi:hypothetical protein